MTAHVIYKSNGREYQSTVHSIAALVELLTWMENTGATLIEVRGEDING